MSLENFKITDEQILKNGVVSAPDKLTGNAAENKALFDNLIRAIVRESVNNIIDILVSSKGASALGAMTLDGYGINLQELLNLIESAAEEAQKNAEDALEKANAASGVDLSTFITKDDVAEFGEAPGLVSLYVNNEYGLGFKEGKFAVIGAGSGTIALKKNGNMPITPRYLDEAIKVGLTTNTTILSNAEKSVALAWLGAPLVSFGTYVGGGELGSSNPTKVACSFQPDVVIVASNCLLGGNSMKPCIRIMSKDGGTVIYEPSSSYDPTIDSSSTLGFAYVDGFISWYGSAVYNQCSISNLEYSWIAFGGNYEGN